MSDNPWDVDSIEVFSTLKCPECIFDSQEEDIFRLHAVENHPMSFVLFGKKIKDEEENENTENIRENKYENDENNYHDDYQDNGDNFDNNEDDNYDNENGQPENLFLASMYEDTDLVKQELSEENSKDDPDYNVEYDSYKEVKSKRPGRIPLKNKKVLSP